MFEETSVVNHILSTENIEAIFEQFYKNELDDVSGHVSISVEDRKALSIMSESIQLVDGHYQTAFPWCQQFTRNLKVRRDGKPSTGHELSLENIREARAHILELVQSAAFPNELKALRSGRSNYGNIANGYEEGKTGTRDELLLHMRLSCKPMKKGTVCGCTIKKLNPFMADDIIRVGGRLQLSCLPFDSKQTITLPSKHFVTDMIVMHCHLQNAHAGITHVLNCL